MKYLKELYNSIILSIKSINYFNPIQPNNLDNLDNLDKETANSHDSLHNIQKDEALSQINITFNSIQDNTIQRIRDIEAKYSHPRTIFDDLNEEISNLKHNIKVLQETTSTTKHELEQKNYQLEYLNKELELTVIQANDSNATISLILNKKNDDIDLLKLQITRLEEENQSLDKQLRTNQHTHDLQVKELKREYSETITLSQTKNTQYYEIYKMKENAFLAEFEKLKDINEKTETRLITALKEKSLEKEDLENKLNQLDANNYKTVENIKNENNQFKLELERSKINENLLQKKLLIAEKQIESLNPDFIANKIALTIENHYQDGKFQDKVNTLVKEMFTVNQTYMNAYKQIPELNLSIAWNEKKLSKINLAYDKHKSNFTVVLNNPQISPNILRERKEEDNNIQLLLNAEINQLISLIKNKKETLLAFKNEANLLENKLITLHTNIADLYIEHNKNNITFQKELEGFISQIAQPNVTTLTSLDKLMLLDSQEIKSNFEMLKSDFNKSNTTELVKKLNKLEDIYNTTNISPLNNPSNSSVPNKLIQSKSKDKDKDLITIRKDFLKEKTTIKPQNTSTHVEIIKVKNTSKFPANNTNNANKADQAKNKLPRATTAEERELMDKLKKFTYPSSPLNNTSSSSVPNKPIQPIQPIKPIVVNNLAQQVSPTTTSPLNNNLFEDNNTNVVD